MKLHCRLQGNRYSFRLRLFDKYIDAGESYATEEEAAFAVDLAKVFLRNYFNVTKNMEPSLDPEHFCMWAHRLSVDLSDRSSIESKLAPGVLSFVANNRAALDAHAESNRVQLRDWEKLRNHPDEAVRKWCNRCEAASVRADAFKAINHEYLHMLLASVCGHLNDVSGPIRRALKMHERASDPVLVARHEELHNIYNAVRALAVVADELATEIARENRSAVEALTLLEANRPPLA